MAFAQQKVDNRNMPLSAIDTWLRNLPSQTERYTLRINLDGANGVIPAPANSIASHILRPDLGLWQGAAFTEVFCQSLARRVGLPAVPTELLQGGEIPASIAPRYDIYNGTKLDAETFADRLGANATLAQCFRLLEEVCDDVRAEQQVLMDMVLFNALIGNSQADAGLFALIFESGGTRIAPLHAALCAAVFPHLPQRLALPIGTAHEPGQLRAGDWEKLASTTQLEPAALATRGIDLAKKVRGESRSLAMSLEPLGGSHLIGIILSAIEQNSMTVVQSLKGFLGQKAA